MESEASAYLGFWIAGLATACLAMAVGLACWLHSPQRVAMDYAKLYREIETTFPNQVRSIVADQNGVRIDLADWPNVPSSPPVLVCVGQPKYGRSIITFSGQSVRLNGETIEVLTDGQGKVLIVGPHAIIQPTEARWL